MSVDKIVLADPLGAHAHVCKIRTRLRFAKSLAPANLSMGDPWKVLAPLTLGPGLDQRWPQHAEPVPMQGGSTAKATHFFGEDNCLHC